MKIQYILSALVFVFSFCVFASSAFAQAGDRGFDVRVHLGAEILKLSGGASVSTGGLSASGVSDEFVDFVGMMGKISFGYRWNYFGVYIDQDLGGVWYQDDDDENGKDDDGNFLGGTFIVGRGIYPIMKNLQVDLAFGIGVMYGAGDSGDDLLKEDAHVSLVMNEDFDPSAAFAIKAGVSLTYYFTDMIGAGIFFDYNFATRTNEYKGNLGIKTELTFKYHVMNPGIQLVARF